MKEQKIWINSKNENEPAVSLFSSSFALLFDIRIDDDRFYVNFKYTFG